MDSLEKLLLLEILVDNVYYEKTAIVPALLEQLRDTNVRFQFFDYPPIDIGEVDFCQTGQEFNQSEVSFKSGKSVLFALPDIALEMRETFDINVTVSRKIATQDDTTDNNKKDNNWKSHELGKCIIHLGESFINLIEATSYDGTCPTSRTVRDSYPFCSEDGTVIGYVTVFIRLSCFGKIIVTQFQADAVKEKDKSFCFKGGQDEGSPETLPEAGFTPQPRTMQTPMFPPPSFMPNQMMPPMIPQPQVINVPTSLKKRPVESRCGRVPSELISTDSDGGKQDYCLRRNCPQGYPQPPWYRGKNYVMPGPPVGTAAIVKDDVLFQMRNPLDPMQMVQRDYSYKLKQEPDQLAQKVKIVNKKTSNPQYDPDYDTFLLKFGTRDGENKPAKLILTLKSPKAPQACKTEQQSQVRLKRKVPRRPISTTRLARALGKNKPREKSPVFWKKRLRNLKR